jgi:hypothetical protein
MSRLRIVVGNSSLARYPQGGGHWTVRLQWLLGLRDLGHDAVLLALFWSHHDTGRDEERVSLFFSQLRPYGLDDRCALLVFDNDSNEYQDLNRARAYGRRMDEVRDLIRTADILWNDCCSVRQPLVGMFEHRVLVDLDPGHIHVSLDEWDELRTRMNIDDHHAFLSVGRKMHDADCEVPTLGLQWRTFTPFVYLPMWEVGPAPGRNRPFTSVTHWTWGELWWRERVLSTSKRAAYLRYLDLPRRAGLPFELAAQIAPHDRTGDREVLQSHGWSLVDPWEVAGSPATYQHYIAGSRAEILCPKPVFRELRTGWFSDRSACYLASGRPVLAEDTGFSDYLPTGEGLLPFRSLDEAVDGALEIDRDYDRHARAARELAEECFDSQKVLRHILAACE